MAPPDRVARALAVLPPGRRGSLIAGEWRTDGAQRFAVHDPASGAVVTDLPSAGRAEAGAAVTAAARAAGDWADRSPRERGELLRTGYALLTADAEKLAALIVAENGKPLAEARAEVAYAAEFLRWFGEEAVRWPGSYGRAPAGGSRLLVGAAPVGVSVLVTPWNAPASMVTRKLGAALAAGCPVVVKPAEQTPLSALFVAELLGRAGVPPGVVNVLTTDRPAQVVETLLDDPRVRKLSFTGSTEVGRLLLGRAARRVLRCSMELGGQASFIVLADADPAAAVAGALLAKMRNGGMSCVAANQFLVARPVAAEFTARLSAAMADLVVGPGDVPASTVGPMISAGERDRLAARVARWRAAGAEVPVGGSPEPGAGFFYPPTVVGLPGPPAPVAEVFGPVAPVCVFDDPAEAVAAANAAEGGLAGYVYGGELGRALRVAESLEVGMVAVNRGLLSDPAAPFGGVKQSGLGREGGSQGLTEYLETRYVSVDW